MLTFRRPSFFDPFFFWGQSAMYVDHPSSSIEDERESTTSEADPSLNICSLFEDRPSSTLFLWGQSTMYVDHPSSSIEDERESTTSEADPSLNIVHWRQSTMFEDPSLNPSSLNMPGITLFEDRPSSTLFSGARRARSTTSEADPSLNIVHWRQSTMFEDNPSSNIVTGISAHFSKTVLLRPFFLWGQSAMYVDHPSSSIEDERESTTSEADPSLNIVHWRQSTMFEDNPSSNIVTGISAHFSKTVLLRPFSLGPVHNVLLTFRRPSFFDPFLWGQSTMYVDHPSSSIEDERESTTSEADPSLNIVHWRQSTMFEDNPSSNIVTGISAHFSKTVLLRPFFFLWGQSAMYVDHPSSSIEDERKSTTSEADPSLNIVHWRQSTMFEDLLRTL
ncbi:unnamed protein product [Acanthosepion pharaonis]|uniref:Uncharacterized protein n=1 Tax=Acanthosepion pharaonis TaxID=158019 RepID=A0A812DTG8_ACAPH|nr:unnamed protein product [Sepia pharaonis]